MDAVYRAPEACVEREVVLCEVRRDRHAGGASLRVTRSVRVWGGSASRGAPEWSPLERGLLTLDADDVRFTGRTTALRFSLSEIAGIDVDSLGMPGQWGHPVSGTELVIIHRPTGQPVAFGSTPGLGKLLSEAAQRGSFVSDSLSNLADAPQHRATLAQRLPAAARLGVGDLTDDELDELLNFWEEENERAGIVVALVNTGGTSADAVERSRAQAYADGVTQQCIRLAEEQDRRLREDSEYQRRWNERMAAILDALDAQKRPH